METIPERIDWLWFLGYALESTIYDHSVLSKARNRWGQDIFKHFFERIVVVQCVEKEVDDANASNNSVDNAGSLNRYINKACRA